ncbi:MAG TPA: sugar ABC transporter permease [Roseiflexaceae bacterium]|nr:sugar ABC transporter permease [Roseiflexaceae bacterium]
MALQQGLEQARAQPAGRVRLSKMARREEREFYLFISLWIIGFVLFDAGPIFTSLGISFTDWSVLTSPKWIGTANYQRMFADPLFYKALWNSIYFGVASVGLGVIVSFLLALLLNQKVHGMAFFRTVFYLPSVVSGIAVAILWIMILHKDFGLLNTALGWVGIKGPGWLVQPQWAMPALILMSLWQGAGGAMVIYLAGLQSVPQHLYEAAEIDGAGPWGKFWNVTVPMMSPVLFYNLIVGFIASIQNFVLVLVMTDGTPANATLVYGLYLYRNAFKFFQMGYASALAWVLLVVIMLFTAAQFFLSKYWVFYEGDLKR